MLSKTEATDVTPYGLNRHEILSKQRDVCLLSLCYETVSFCKLQNHNVTKQQQLNA